MVRVIAILIEIGILTLIFYCFLAGARLTIFDLGLVPKYKKMVTVALVIVGGIVVTFFIAHLTLLYPTIEVG